MHKRKFIKAYKEYNEPIYRFIYFKVSSKEVAQDLASEVFLKTWDYAKKNKVQNLRALSYRIARNLIIDYYRKQKPIFLEDQDVAKEDKSYLDIRKALTELPNSYREAVSLYYIEGFSQKEIAEILNKSESTIGVLVHRGLKILKEKL